MQCIRQFSSFTENLLRVPPVRLLQTSVVNNRIPPDLSHPRAERWDKKIHVKQAKKTGHRRPLAHQWRELERTYNVRKVPTEEEAQEQHARLAPEVVGAVNQQFEDGRQGRLFAVVQVTGKQFLVKTEDTIIVQGVWGPQIGDVIRLEKVLMMGGRDFSIFGRPLVPLDQSFVEATVVDKRLSNTTMWLKKQHGFRKARIIKFLQQPQTFLRINSVCFLNPVNHASADGVEGLQGRQVGQL